MGQRIPELYDTVKTGREKLGQRRMRTQRPQFVGVAQDGRAKAHWKWTDQNTIASRPDEQLRSAAFGYSTNAAQMFRYLLLFK